MPGGLSISSPKQRKTKKKCFKSKKFKRKFCDIIGHLILVILSISTLLSYLLFSFKPDPTDPNFYEYSEHNYIPFGFFINGNEISYRNLYDYCTILLNTYIIFICLHYLWTYRHKWEKLQNGRRTSLFSNALDNITVKDYDDDDDNRSVNTIKTNDPYSTVMVDNHPSTKLLTGARNTNIYSNNNSNNNRETLKNGGNKPFNDYNSTAILFISNDNNKARFSTSKKESLKFAMKVRKMCVNEFTIEWNEFNIAVFLGTIHQFMTALLLVTTSVHDHSYIWVTAAFAYFVKSIGYMCITICLLKFIQYEYKNELVKRVSFFGDKKTQFILLFCFISQFLMFLTFPTINRQHFANQIDHTYDCMYTELLDNNDNSHDKNILYVAAESNKGCRLQANFVINEMIFRIFVAITLVNIIVHILTILFNQNWHEQSFRGISTIMHPCLFIFLIVFELLEVTVAYDNFSSDYLVWNMIWIIINGFTFIILLYYIIASQFLTDNSYIEVETKKLTCLQLFEGILLVIGKLVVVYLLLSDDIDEWGLWRQGVIAVSIIIQIIGLLYFKKPKNKNHNINICFGQIELDILFYWIVYLNLYNLLWSIIFEMGHFLDFLTAHHEETLPFLWAFSIAFCVTHADLWILSQYCEFAFNSYDGHKHSLKSQGYNEI